MQHHLRDNYILQQLVEEFETADMKNPRYFGDKDLLKLIYYYEWIRDYDKALEVIDQGLERFKYNSEFYVAEARVYGQLKNFPSSLSAAERGLNISPKDTELRIQRVYAQAALGALDEGMRDLEDLVTNTEGRDLVDVLLCKAYVAEAQRDYQEMYDILVRAIQIDGRHPVVLERIWVAVELLKNYEDSIVVHERLIDSDPYNHLAWYNLGHAYAFIGNYELSAMAFEYAYLIEPSFDLAYKDCADLYYQVGHVKRSLGIYLEAIEALEEVDLEIMLSVGRCYLDLGRPEDARPYLIDAIKLDPFEEDARYLLGRSYFQVGAFERARKQYARAIQIDDMREEFYDDLAKCYHLMGDPDMANYYFERATSLCPEDVSYWFHHIVFLLDIQSYDHAQSVLDQALEHTYGAPLLYARAAIAMKNGEKAKGLTLLEEAVQDDENEVSQFYLLYPEGEQDEQIQALLRYMTMDVN